MTTQMKLKFQDWLRSLSNTDFVHTRKYLTTLRNRGLLTEVERIECEDKLELVEAELAYRQSYAA